MVLAEFSIFPVGQGESLSPYVARVVRLVRQSGLPNELHAMGTIVEGEWDEVFGLIRACASALEEDCPRVSLSIKADIRRGGDRHISRKVESVEARLRGVRPGGPR